MKLILASASPRRADLLRSAGLEFEIRSSEIDENPLPNEGAEDLVQRLSATKAAKIAEACPDALVLAADTVVVYDDEIFGKPATPEQARLFLQQLSGDAHEVMTGFTLRHPKHGSVTRLVITRVDFRELSAEEIQRYVDSGEPMDKAGAYGIQGGGAGFVSRIEGSYTNVVGLPLAEVLSLLQDYSLSRD